MDLLPYETLMAALREKRRDLGVEQRRVASEAGVSPSQLSRMENANTMATYETVYRVWETLQRLDGEIRETAADLATSEIAWVGVGDSAREARRLMLDGAFSQLPVREASDSGVPADGETGSAVGSVTERGLLAADSLDRPVREVMDGPFVEVRPETSESAVRTLLTDGDDAVLVRDGDRYVGIVTPMDLV